MKYAVMELDENLCRVWQVTYEFDTLKEARECAKKCVYKARIYKFVDEI